MKFKYGDEVQIDSEFYGKRKGIIRSYKTELGAQLATVYVYVVEFFDDKELLREWFKEEELK